MRTLFDKQMEICLHKYSQSEIIILSTEWHKGRINYRCLVPQKDEKGKCILCNATYDESEIEIIPEFIK